MRPDWTDADLEKHFPKIASGVDLLAMFDEEKLGPITDPDRFIWVKVTSGQWEDGIYLIHRRDFVPSH